MKTTNEIKTPTSKTPTIGYFPALDTLRFICATGVIFHHTWLKLSKKGYLQNSIHEYSGSFFLDVFFIISGFLISFILIKEIQTEKYNLKNFYMRRVIRIWPLFFLIVILRIIITPMAEHTPWETIKTNLAYALSFSINYQLICEQVTKTYSILWSVCIEEHIYLLLPLFLLLFNKNIKNIALFLIISGIASWLFFSKVSATNGYNIAYFLSSSYFYYFGIGALIAYFHKSIQDNLKIFFTPTAQVIVFTIIFFYVFNQFSTASYRLPCFLLCCGLFGAYMVCIAMQQKSILKLNPAFTRYLGNISYAMYMVHIVSIGIVFKSFTKNATKLSSVTLNFWMPVAATLFSIALASLLYYVFERPILKLKTKYTSVLNK